uniref:NADPH--cytochrome P450 reductase n=1 Tax=Panagrolaimus sp. ES5 TaxID=591445 RepID=A0AC34F7F5_9BILA
MYRFPRNIYGGRYAPSSASSRAAATIRREDAEEGGAWFPCISKKPDESYINRMKNEDRQVLILFGSQTGTAEELAGRLAKDLVRYGRKALVMDPEEVDADDFDRIIEIKDPLLILCVATYGEGEPTDNVHKIYTHLQKANVNFAKLRYAVFGLGNKTYEHYNAVGKFFDQKLEKLGAKRILKIGLGDDDENLEVDFIKWRDALLPALAQSFKWCRDRQYRLEIIKEPISNIFSGEYGRIGAYLRQIPPFDQKNPYLSKIVVHKELQTYSRENTCLHIEFNIEGSQIKYEAGDHLAVLPKNDGNLVEKLCELLNANLGTVFTLINFDEESSKRHPFPCPCTYETALTHYVDICAPVKSHVLKALVEYTTDESQKERLNLLSSASKYGLLEYARFIGKERRNIINILELFDTCKPPIDYLLELLPRLQARYYSISSSQKVQQNIISITAVITQYSIGNHLIKGVCTHYLSQLKANDTTPIFVRKSTMHLPLSRPYLPVIMIGPGTGFAPFRGFLQERSWQKSQAKTIEEILKYEAEKVITKRGLALFRNSKYYFESCIMEEGEKVWNLIQNNAYIYVCGDARNMAHDVKNTFLKVFQQFRGMDVETSQNFFQNLELSHRYRSVVWS